MMKFLNVDTVVREVPRSELTSECWIVQFEGLAGCDDCEALNTPDCGGQTIRATLKNERGLSVPLGRAL